MKVGVQLPSFTWPGGPAALGPTLAGVARAVEAAGFHSLWVMDHFFQIETFGPPEAEMLEAYTTLGFCAAATGAIRLGVLATGVVYRHPGVLIKAATTLDVLSGGRACLGIGAAWYEREAKGLGVPFPPLATRFEMLEETLRIARQMWSGEVGAFDGRHYRLAETLCVPQPLSRPHPPILVAGGGAQKTLRLVARYADACNLFGEPAAVAPKLEVLERHCEAIGRDYRSIEKTVLAVPPSATGETIALCRALADIGTDQVIFSLVDANDESVIEAFAREVIPAAAAF